MSRESVSRMEIVLTAPGKGEARAELSRHLSPITVSALARALPLAGRVHRFGDDFVYLVTGLRLGSEKSRTNYRAGELGLLAANGSVCIFLRDTIMERGMNPLGRISQGMDIFKSLAPGDTLAIRAS